MVRRRWKLELFGVCSRREVFFRKPSSYLLCLLLLPFCKLHLLRYEQLRARLRRTARGSGAVRARYSAAIVRLLFA